MNIKISRILSVFILISLSVCVFAEGIGKGKALGKTAGSPAETKFNINNVATYFSTDGGSDLDPAGNSGFIFPKGSGKGVFYESGFIWGAKIDDQIRVGGSTYNHGIVGGKILNSGLPANQLIAEDNDAANVRIYRVRRDYKTGSLTPEAIDESKTVDQIYAQYEKDWNEWPAADGAPFNDLDSNGVYDPEIDIPGFPGADQTIWFVSNDLNVSSAQGLYGSPPMGVEVQTTIWGYNQAGPLGNMLFRKYLLINKSSKSFEDTYVAMWSDPDLGDATDDFAGCDTTLSLGYIYNGTASDGVYSDGRIPASGFDFFQGPLVQGEEGDTAIFKNAKVAGMKNLPMTAFFYFINSDDVYSDPSLGNYQGSIEMYNLLQGKIGTTGDYFPIPDELGGGVTTLPLSGDPVTGSGYIDGILYEPGDRRFGMASGPFTMAAGDTQEVVVAQLAARSGDNLASVTLLKSYDKVAQDAYDNFFVLPNAPEPPKVDVTELDGSIVLNWGKNLEFAEKTESQDDQGFKFQGYNVYQLPDRFTTDLELATKVKTFDIIDGVKTITGQAVDAATGANIVTVQQTGSDNGISRSFEITKDYIKGTKLVNGNKYYFAVTAYNYNEDPLAVPNNIENPIAIVTVIPQGLNPGYRYESAYNDTIATTHGSGVSGGYVIPVVEDPKEVTGGNYTVYFEDDVNTGETVWGIKNSSNTVLSSGLPQLPPSSNGSEAPVIDGLKVMVFGPEVVGTDFSYTGSRWLSGTSSNGGELMFGAAFVGPNFWGETTVAPGDLRDVHVDVFNIDSYTDENGNGKYDLGEPYVVNPDSGQVVNLYTTWGAGHWEQSALIPMKFYAIEPDGSKRQVDVVVRDRDGNGQWDPSDADGLITPFNYVFVLNTDYDPTGNQWNPTAGGRDFMDEILADGGPVLWTFWWYQRGSMEQFANGFTMDFVAPKVNTVNDQFTFTAPTATYDSELAKEDAKNINVYPNPYYAVNTEEINKYERFVTFTHLPRKADIKVFNLAGQLVRSIQKEDNTQFARWDLKNDSGLPAASGLYIAYIDLPEVGKTVTLKLAIIQEQQILDRF